MPRHVQRPERPERLEASVIGTVALAVVLLVVSGVFLAWGHFVDPAGDAAADPAASPADAVVSTYSTPTASSVAVQRPRHGQVAPQRIVLRTETIKRIKAPK